MTPIDETLEALGTPQAVEMADRCIELFGIFKNDEETDVENADHARRRLVLEFLKHGPEWLQIVSAYPALREEIKRLRDALQKIAETEKAPDAEHDEYGFDTCHVEGYNDGLEVCQSIARRTLQGDEDNG